MSRGKVPKKSLYFLALLAALAVLGGLALHDDVDASIPELHPAVGTPVSNDHTDRTFRELDLQEDFRLGVDQGVYRPEIVKVDEDGVTVLLDYGDLSVKKFSTDGRPLWTYSPGKGQGPGQFLIPTDLTIAEDGAIWIADPDNGRILILSEDGDLASSIRIAGRPYRIIRPGEQGFSLMWIPPADRLFAEIDERGEVVNEFGEILSQQDRNGLVLDGWVVDDARGGFVYASMYLGMFAGFDGDSSLRFLSATVEPGDTPRILRNDTGRVWLSPDVKPKLKTMSVDRGRLYAHASLRGSARDDVIDVYSLDGGGYLHSFQLSGRFDLAAVRGDALVTVRDGEVVKWSFRVRPGR